MRPRLPSDPERDALESFLLRIVCPIIGLVFDGVLLATDSHNSLAYAMASGLLFGPGVAKLRRGDREDDASDS